MVNDITELALQGLHRKKRSSRLVFFVLLISFAFAILSLSLVGSIQKTNGEFRLNNYGEWYFAIPTGLPQDADMLQRQAWAEAVGTSQNYGSVITKAGTVGFGTLDPALMDIGRIRLDDGRWPENDNEIAVEARTLSLLGYDYTLGQKILLPVGIPVGEEMVTAEHTFTVCGIIHEYSNLWVLNRNTYFQSLVSAVVTPAAAEEVLAEIKAMIPPESEIEPDSIQPIPQFFISVAPENREAALESIKSYLQMTHLDFGDLTPSENYVAYPEMAATPPDTFYTCMIAGVTLLAVLCAYIMQLPAEVKSYATLRSIGITKAQLAWLLLTESALLCLPAILLGIPLGVGLTWLVLRLLMYSGSVPIQVDIPYAAMGLVVLLWFAMVLVSRLLVFFVTIRTPLVGRFQIQASKARRTRRFRNLLITLLLIAFGGVSVYTVLNSLPPIHSRQWWQSCPAYVIWADGPVSLEDVMLMEQVPGVQRTDGFAEVEATVSFDGLEEQPIWMYAVDAEGWDMTFDFGKDAEAFQKGELCLLLLPDDGQDYPLPKGPVTIQAKSGPISETQVSVRYVADDVLNRLLANLYEPYTVICSHAYMKQMVSALEPGEKWDVFTGGEDYGYDRVYVSVDMAAEDLSTDLVMAELCARQDIVFDNRRQETMAYIQENTQRLILLYTAGGCVALVLLMILASAVSLETEQEKRYYGTLRVLGMSKRQMGLDIVKKALGRAVLAAVSGWILYFPILLHDKLANINDTPGEAFWSALKFNEPPIGVIFGLLGGCLSVILVVCLLGKCRLKKGVETL